jgi:lysophospholipase L1-like esterase
MPRNTSPAYPPVLIMDGAIPHGRAAELFGLHPDSPAAFNREQLQAALNAGGLVTLLSPGVYPLDADTLTAPAGVTFMTGPGVAFTVAGIVQPLHSLAHVTAFAGSPITPRYTAILLADSIGSYAEVSLSATSVTDNGDGTAAIVGPSGVAVGDPVRVIGAPTVASNTLDGVVTAVTDATHYTVSTGGRSHPITSVSTPTLTFPWRKSSRGFLTALETLTGVQFDTEWCAVGGATAAQVLEVAADSSYGPFTVAFVCVGMNNIYSAAQTFETAAAEIQAVIDHARSVARHVVVLSIPPRDSTDTAWSSGKQTVHNKVNRWLHLYCVDNALIFCNTWRAAFGGNTYVNPAASNPDPLAAMVHDKTHPSFVGANAIAASLAALLSPVLRLEPYKAAHLAMLGADVGNILTDADFATGASSPTNFGVTDATTNIVTATSMVSRTVATHGDALGRLWRVTANYGTATGQASFRCKRTSSIHSLLTAGKKLKAYWPFALSSALDVQGVDIAVQGTMAGGQTWQVFGNAVDSNTKGFAGSLSGWCETPEAIIPAGITDCKPFLRVTFGSGQTSNLTFDNWHPIFRVYD